MIRFLLALNCLLAVAAAGLLLAGLIATSPLGSVVLINPLGSALIVAAVCLAGMGVIDLLKVIRKQLNALIALQRQAMGLPERDGSLLNRPAKTPPELPRIEPSLTGDRG